MDNRLIALLLVEEYRKRDADQSYSSALYLAFLKSIACRSTDRYKGMAGYQLAVKQIEVQ
jgi:hypothetical protein